MAEEWVDHSLDVARKAEKGLEVAEKAHAEVDKKLKETLAQLSEVEKDQRNAEMALIMVKLKQTKKQLEAKEAEKAQAEQATYDAGMTKAAKSLIAHLKDVAHAFCLEVSGQALNAVGVNTESELRGPDKVYYPFTLRLAPTLPQPPADPSSAPPSSSVQPDLVPSPTSAKGKKKKKELPPPANVLDVETEKEVAEAG